MITNSLLITDAIDLHGAILTSFAHVETANLGASESYPSSFTVEGALEPPKTSLLPITLQVTPAMKVALGSLVT